MTDHPERTAPSLDFVRAIIAADVESGKHGGAVVTRFPPEPNGFLHIGHVKAICLSFDAAAEQGGVTHLRFDDTNPETEDELYVRAMQEDVRWLGFDWGEHLYFASDYFERLYQYAIELIEAGLAYVDSASEEEIREHRGTVTEPGRPTAYRDRSVEENLDLFRRMREGEFGDGAHVLRAKIDLASTNMLMRDPVFYRIRHADHYRTGGDWCIYPLYDFTHCLSDSIEGITHSLCTLEFVNNRELYDWILDHVDVPQPQPRQYEFAPLVVEYTVLSKRMLLPLVQDGRVDGWDDPRMSTLAGMRRRGVPPAALRTLCDMVGVARAESRIDLAKLEYVIRDELNPQAPRVMCVLRPLKLVIDNFPEGEVEELDAPYFPKDIGKEGSRLVPFTREILIERDDFEETPPKGFRRLAPGREVRLRYGYVVRCADVVKDENGVITEVHCTYDPDTRGGSTPDGRTVKGTIHWVSASHSLPAEVRLYEPLFSVPDPEDVEEGEDFTVHLNPDSLTVLTDSRIEPSIGSDPPDTTYQFERTGYFVHDAVDSKPDHLVFNRTVTLRDSWAKARKAEEREALQSGGAEGAAAKSAASEPRPAQVADGTASDGTPTGATAAPTGASPVSPRPEDPEAASRYDRLREEHGLAESEASVLARDAGLFELFREGSEHTADDDGLAKWIVNELPRVLEDRPIASLLFGGRELARLVELVSASEVSGRAARDVLVVLAEEGGDPDTVIEERGLGRVSDASTLRPMVARLIEAHPTQAQGYRDGKTGLMGFFIGQVMKETNGAADPEVTQSLLREALIGESRD
jgi:glutaminyl-tRNA synthetase